MSLIQDNDDFSKVLLQNFTTDEQKLFVQSFQAYLQYGNDDNAFVVDLDYVWEWLGFTRKDSCQKILYKNFQVNIHYTKNCLLRQVAEQRSSNRGGHNKEQVLMTVNTFKKLCMKACTKRADEVCDYYIKMEQIMQRYVHQRLQNRSQHILELQHQVSEHTKNIELARHKTLIDAHHLQRLVYIMKVEEFSDGKFVIKIGESSDIKDRVEKLNSLFKKQVIVLDVFTCARNYELEQVLHKTKGIVEHKYTEKINNTVKSTETFMVNSMKHYKSIIKIVKQLLYTYKNENTENNKWSTINRIIDMCQGDTHKLKEILSMLNEPNDINDNESSSDEYVNEENTLTPQQSMPPSASPIKAFGPKVQLYDGNDITRLIRVFDSITIATREISDASFTQIKFAARNKKLYLGYRWHLIDRADVNPNEPREIGETVETKVRKTGLVARLSLDKSSISHVYTNQKIASDAIQQHPSAICTAIKYGSQLSGSFWMLWDDVSPSLQEAFRGMNQLPNEPKRKPRGVIVQQIHPTTEEIVNQYASISDMCKAHKVSPNSIKEAALQNTPFLGYHWKFIH